MTALVTGATGFVGAALCRELEQRAIAFLAATRSMTGDLSGSTDWSACLDGVDTVFHLAGRAHVFDARSAAEACRRVNVDATMSLARTAASRGVRTFVFVSSVKVNGDEDPGRPLRETDEPHPADVYGASKAEAERELAALAATSGMRVVIVRPPLVYGPGVKANFFNLMRAVDRGIPLPLAAIRNARSFVYVGNLCDALIAVAASSGPAVETFFVRDGEDVSTPDLIRRIASAFGRRARMMYVPPSLLIAMGRMMGKGDAVHRLVSSLRVDDASIRERAGWQPRYSLDAGLRVTADWYRQRTR
jgi:nucleoside-diphosphate-sugar epimerase